ncbi:Hypothetical predicted protein [Lecanosticta acicola]|uniref:Uncharacterized protein n=1 Tax=Lecanosticta acicola TaxID=111012 RepID=A0AAI8Z662_9PEZI|nr:Hypothetical predicted protein [Lecanosticta acicola]
MARTIQSAPNSDIRAQIRANASSLGLDFIETVIALKNKTYTAWVMIFTNPRQAIIKGPPGATYEEALEGLLDTTAELAATTFEKDFKAFEEQLSEQVGEGFVLEKFVAPTPVYKGK